MANNHHPAQNPNSGSEGPKQKKELSPKDQEIQKLKMEKQKALLKAAKEAEQRAKEQEIKGFWKSTGNLFDTFATEGVENTKEFVKDVAGSAKEATQYAGSYYIEKAKEGALSAVDVIAWVTQEGFAPAGKYIASLAASGVEGAITGVKYMNALADEFGNGVDYYVRQLPKEYWDAVIVYGSDEAVKFVKFAKENGYELPKAYWIALTKKGAKEAVAIASGLYKLGIEIPAEFMQAMLTDLKNWSGEQLAQLAQAIQNNVDYVADYWVAIGNMGAKKIVQTLAALEKLGVEYKDALGEMMDTGLAVAKVKEVVHYAIWYGYELPITFWEALSKRAGDEITEVVNDSIAFVESVYSAGKVNLENFARGVEAAMHALGTVSAELRKTFTEAYEAKKKELEEEDRKEKK